MTNGQLQRRTFLAALAGSLPAAAAFGRPTMAGAARAAGGPKQVPPPANSFDLDAGNAPAELIIPAVIPVIYRRMSPKGNDATLVLHVTTMLTNTSLGTIAPYHPTAVGVCSLHGRRPRSEATDRSRNLAILQASVPVLESLFPRRRRSGGASQQRRTGRHHQPLPMCEQWRSARPAAQRSSTGASMTG